MVHTPSGCQATLARAGWFDSRDQCSPHGHYSHCKLSFADHRSIKCIILYPQHPTSLQNNGHIFSHKPFTKNNDISIHETTHGRESKNNAPNIVYQSVITNMLKPFHVSTFLTAFRNFPSFVVKFPRSNPWAVERRVGDLGRPMHLID